MSPGLLFQYLSYETNDRNDWKIILPLFSLILFGPVIENVVNSKMKSMKYVHLRCNEKEDDEKLRL